MPPSHYSNNQEIISQIHFKIKIHTCTLHAIIPQVEQVCPAPLIWEDLWQPRPSAVPITVIGRGHTCGRNDKEHKKVKRKKMQATYMTKRYNDLTVCFVKEQKMSKFLICMQHFDYMGCG